MLKRLLMVVALSSFSCGTSHAAAYDDLVRQLEAAMTAACNLQESCLQTVTSFAYFLWRNRDKSDIQYNAMKCIGYSAVQRGYIWSPMKVLDDMTPAVAEEISFEVCDCVVGYWGEGWVCPIER